MRKRREFLVCIGALAASAGCLNDDEDAGQSDPSYPADDRSDPGGSTTTAAGTPTQRSTDRPGTAAPEQSAAERTTEGRSTATETVGEPTTEPPTTPAKSHFVSTSEDLFAEAIWLSSAMDAQRNEVLDTDESVDQALQEIIDNPGEATTSDVDGIVSSEGDLFEELRDIDDHYSVSTAEAMEYESADARESAVRDQLQELEKFVEIGDEGEIVSLAKDYRSGRIDVSFDTSGSGVSYTNGLAVGSMLKVGRDWGFADALELIAGGGSQADMSHLLYPDQDLAMVPNQYYAGDHENEAPIERYSTLVPDSPGFQNRIGWVTRTTHRHGCNYGSCQYDTKADTGVLFRYGDEEAATTAYDQFVSNAYHDGTTETIGSKQTRIGPVDRIATESADGETEYLFSKQEGRFLIAFALGRSTWDEKGWNLGWHLQE